MKLSNMGSETDMARRRIDPQDLEKLNTLSSALRVMIDSGEEGPAINIMKGQLKKRIREIHQSKIYASKKMHTVKGKEVPIYWYARDPRDYNKKLFAPTEDELYEKLADIYTGRGINITAKGPAESDNSLRNIFKRYIKNAAELSPRSIEERQRIWDIYLEDTDLVKMDICSITSSDITCTYRNIISKGMISGKPFQQNYFNAVSGCVHAIYKYAITFEGLPVIDLPKSLDYSMLSFRQTEQKNDDILAKALTPEQLKRAFEWCETNSDDLPVLALWLNFYLALRFAELYALRWCDVHVKEHYIHVCGQMDKKGHIRQEHTKKRTAEGVRDIPLTDEAISIFQRILLKKPDDSTTTDLIFPIGGYSTYKRRCKNCFQYALDTDTVPEHYVTHTVRATAASTWYAHGISPKMIQSLLGHTTTGMTLRYCHDLSSRDEMREEMSRAMAV